MAITAPDEAATRTRLANVAQFGAAGANMPTAAPAPTDPRQGAIDAALARGSQIGAPAAVQDQIGGRIGAVYDAGNQGLGAIRGANAGAVGGVNNATDEYLRQLDLAKPIEEGRNKIAIQQILADKAKSDKSSAFQDKQFDFENKKFNEDVRQWNILHPDPGTTPTIDLAKAGADLGYSPSQTQAILSNPQYQLAKPMIQEALASKADFNEFKGLVNSWTGDPKLGIEGSPTIDQPTADYLIRAYGGQFQSPTEKANPYVTTGAKGAPGAYTSNVPIVPTAADQNKIQGGKDRSVAIKAVDSLTPHQRGVLQILANSAGMDPVTYLQKNPDLMGRKSGKTGKLILAP